MGGVLSCVKPSSEGTIRWGEVSCHMLNHQVKGPSGGGSCHMLNHQVKGPSGGGGVLSYVKPSGEGTIRWGGVLSYVKPSSEGTIRWGCPVIC